MSRDFTSAVWAAGGHRHEGGTPTSCRPTYSACCQVQCTHRSTDTHPMFQVTRSLQPCLIHSLTYPNPFYLKSTLRSGLNSINADLFSILIFSQKLYHALSTSASSVSSNPSQAANACSCVASRSLGDMRATSR